MGDDRNAGRVRLVLVGGGHTHVHVLRSLAMRPEPALRVTLVSPFSYATYSGMVPGVLAGQYEIGAARIDVRALAGRARAGFIAGRALGVDAERRRLELEGRPALAYDLLSLDIGSRPAESQRVASGAPVLLVKPIEVAAEGVEKAFAAPPPAGGRRVVIVGAGPGGTEVAFALAARLEREPSGSVTVVDLAPLPVAERGARTAARVLKAFARRGIAFIGSSEVQAVDGRGVHLAGGRLLEASLVVWATGAAGPTLLRDSGLPVDRRGFLRVGNDLRSVEHGEIFAAGDCATLEGYPDLAKAGVFAVRQGRVLAHNLRAAARGANVRLQVYVPQSRFLSLLNTGDGRAILSYGPLAAEGRWAWRLKDRIDRAFIRKYARPAPGAAAKMGGEMIPCGGCAAKAGADVLARVLARLDLPPSEGVLAGLRPPDDAAVFAHPPGTLAVATADMFPPFDDDLHLVGQVAAVNAASDLYAMGAEGSAALALVCLPQGDERQAEEDLEQLLGGAVHALRRLAIPLAGGHTIAGEQALVGFSMHGWARPERLLRKAGARPGDRLVLSKPLGTGVVLAAARAGCAAAEWTEAAHASMLRSNRAMMHLLLDHEARACTDVSGFGLAGHLGEMLGAGAVGARIARRALPALPGSMDLLCAGWRSSFHETNRRAQSVTEASAGDPSLALMLDPQTSGGLLAAVPDAQLARLERACSAAGEPMHVIGEIVAGPASWELV
jgi:selenide,water dikinase